VLRVFPDATILTVRAIVPHTAGKHHLALRRNVRSDCDAQHRRSAGGATTGGARSYNYKKE